MAMEEVRKRLTIETQSSGLDQTASGINKVADAEARLTVETTKSEKAQLSLDSTFAKLERRYVDGVRQQQDLAKVQAQVNAAVAQNPALASRANNVIAEAEKRILGAKAANDSFYDSLSQRSTWKLLAREAALAGGPLGQLIGTTGLLTIGSSRLSLGIVGGTIALSAFAATAAAAVNKYTELETHQVKLTNAILATKGASGQTSASIEAMVQQQSRSGTQSLDTIRDAAAGLVRYRDVAGESFSRVLAVSHDLAATGFTDLKGATQALGESLRDPTQATEKLASVGIQLSVAQQRLATDFYNSGQNAKAYQVILDAVAERTKGADLRLSDTVSGQWGKATNAAQGYLETIGKAISEQTRLKDLLRSSAGAFTFLSNTQFNGAGPRSPTTPANDNRNGAQSVDEAGFSSFAQGMDQAAERVAKVRDGLDATLRTAKLLPPQAELFKLQEQAGVLTANELKNGLLGAGVAAQQIAEKFKAIQAVQINRDLDAQLANLIAQSRAVSDISLVEQARASAAAEYAKNMALSADSQKAGAVAAQTIANARLQQDAQDTARAERDAAVAAEQRYQACLKAARAEQQIAEQAERAAVAAEKFYQAMKFVPGIAASIGSNNLFTTAGGGSSQFNPAGYKSSTPSLTALSGNGQYGPGGYTAQLTDKYGGGIVTPNAAGYDFQANKTISGGGSIADVINQILSTRQTIDDVAAQAITKYAALLPEGQQAGAISATLDRLYQQPETIAGDALIKQLTDQLATLTKATTENTSATAAMTDVLSPLYSSDTRQTHQGFRAFAGGGIMTQWGELPIHNYAGGGITQGPQVSVFGEGSTPEAYVPVPSGRIPVTIQQPANSNQKDQRPIIINNNFHGPVDSSTADQLKVTGYQNAQAMRRAMAQ